MAANRSFRDSKGTGAAAKIGNVIDARFGHRESLTDRNGKTLHLFFLDRTPLDLDQNRVEAIRRPSERWQLNGQVFYLHTPEGFGDSKLASQVERILGVATTVRNWRTVCALLELARPTA